MKLDFILFSLNIDTSFINVLGSKPLYEILWYFFINGGWIALLIIFLAAAWNIFLNSRQSKFAATCSWILLAIDIPRKNEQTLKAVENIFSQMAGTHAAPNLVEKYWKGMYQKTFSLELVSIDGYIQFLIRCPAENRDLIEAAVYAQYPDAEITEVADYAKAMDMSFPNDKYNMWGADFVLAADTAFPIRTYPEFEDSLSQEFKDPMAALLEILSRLKKGEQLWLQILVTPIGPDWKKDGEKVINGIMGIKKASKKGLMESIAELPMTALKVAGDVISGPSAPAKEEAKPMMFIPPLEKTKVDGIQRKIAKTGFSTKIRMVYLGKKEVFSKARGVAAVIGALKQYNTQDLNAFKPDGIEKTAANYFFINRRVQAKQNRIFQHYISRSNDGAKTFVLNTEELATIFHFPTDFVKAPLVKKIESKKAEPPMSLPIIEEIESELPVLEPLEEKKKKENFKPEESEEIKLKSKGFEESLPGIDFERDYFEQRFAKKKKPQKNEVKEEVPDFKDVIPPNLPIE